MGEVCRPLVCEWPRPCRVLLRTLPVNLSKDSSLDAPVRRAVRVRRWMKGREEFGQCRGGFAPGYEVLECVVHNRRRRLVRAFRQRRQLPQGGYRAFLLYSPVSLNNRIALALSQTRTLETPGSLRSFRGRILRCRLG